MIVCAISDKTVRTLRKNLFGRLNKNAAADLPFNLKEYMAEIYANVFDKVTNEEAKHATALSYARLIPRFIQQATSVSKLASGLAKHNFDFNEAITLNNALQDSPTSLEAVESFLGLEQANELEDLKQANSVIPTVAAKPKVPMVTEATAVTKTPTQFKFHGQTRSDIETLSFMDSAAKTAEADLRFPPTPLYDYFRDPKTGAWEESRSNPNDFYFKVKRNLLKRFAKTGYEADKMTVNIEGIEIEVFLTAKSVSSENASKYDTDVDMSKDPAQDGVFMFVTNSHGDPLNFDVNGEPTLDYQAGKMAYYRIRAIKDGPIQPNWKDEKLIDVLANEVYDGDKAAAREDYKQQMRVLQRMRQYIHEDKKNNMVKTRINGGTQGYAVKDNKNFQKISDVDFDQAGGYSLKFARINEPAKGMKSGFTYIVGVDGFYGQPLEIERPRVDGVSTTEGMLKDKLTSLLVDPIEDKNGNQYSYADRKALIDFFIMTRPSGLEIFHEKDMSADQFQLKLKGEKLDISTPESRLEVKKLLNNYFSEFGPIRKVDKPSGNIIAEKAVYEQADLGSFIEKRTKRQGKPDLKTYWVIEKPQLHILGTREKKSYLSKKIPDITLATNDAGNVIMTPVKDKIVYSDFIMENYGLKYQQRAGSKKIRKYDAYFTFAPTAEAMGEMFPETLTNEIENNMAKQSPIVAQNTVTDRKQTAIDDIGFDIIEDMKGVGQEVYETIYTDLEGEVHHIQKTTRKAVLTEITKLANKDEIAVKKVKTPEAKNSLTPNGRLKLGSIDDIIDDANTLNKLDTVKAKDIAATKKQLAEIPAWWAKHPMSKHVPLEAIFTMINTKNPDAVATWAASGITLFKGSDYSDLYHEAWHSFTQSFLSKDQKKELYGEARKKSGSFTDHLGKRVLFRQASDLQLEEYMAEDFRKYMLKGGRKKANAPVKDSIFRKVLNALKAIFSNSTTNEIITDERADATIHELYEKMRVGNLAEYTFSQENAQFGELNKGMQASNTNAAQEVLSYQNSQLLSDTVSSLMSEWSDYRNARKTDEQKLEIAHLESQLNDPNVRLEEKKDIPAKLKALTKPQTYEFSSAVYTNPKMQLEAYKYSHHRIGQLYNTMLDKADAETNEVEKALLEKNAELLLWAYENFGNLKELGANKAKDGEPMMDVMGYHMAKNEEYLGQAVTEYFGDVQEMSETEQGEKGKKFEVSGNERSMTEIASNDVLYLIRGLHKLDPKTKQPVLNKLGAKELVSFQEVWNRTSRTLENTLDADNMYDKLTEESVGYPVFKQLLNKLGPVGSANNLTQTNLWTNFANPFSMTRIPLIQMTVLKQVNKKGDVSWEAHSGQAMNSTSKILRTWESEFSMRQPNRYTKKDINGNYLDVANIVEDFKQSANAPAGKRLAGREVAFLHAMGLNVVDNPKVIEQLTSNNTISFLYSRIVTLNARGIKARSFKEMYDALPQTVDANGQIAEYAKPRMETRFKYVSGAHARYADEGSNFMVTNAEGNTQFEHSLNNSMTVMVTALNDAQNYSELLGMPHMAHLDVEANPFAKASTWLNTLFILDVEKGNSLYGSKRTIDGEVGSPEIKIDYTNLSGVLVMEEEGDAFAGIASAKADEVTKLILDFHLSTQLGQPELMRHADKSTSYSSYLKHIYNKVDGGITSKYIENTDFLLTDDDTSLGSKGYDTTAYSFLIGHVAAEFSRIKTMRAMKNPEDIDFNYWKKGKDFTAFNSVFSKGTKKRMLDLVTEIEDLETFLNTPEGASLQGALREEMANYFASQVDKVANRFDKNNFVADNLLKELRTAASSVYGKNTTVSPAEAKAALVKSYVYNTWINNVESIALFYGDLALYNHKKQEFHKRNAGMGSTGTLYRTDNSFKEYINSQGRLYTENHGGMKRTYDGTMDTAVIRDSNVKSAYYDEYVSIYTKHFMDTQGLTETKAKAKAKAELGAYAADNKGVGRMNEGDAQGWVSFDSYRILKTAEGKWGKDQEKLYNDIVNGKVINPEDVLEFFPTIKAQYYGPLQNQMEGLPITAMHKFSLLPLIPTMIQGTNLQNLHTKMMNEGIDYALYESGSKVGTITKEGTPDAFYKEGRNTVTDAPFTKNTIFVNYLKNQLEIAPEFKKKGVPFPTQLRKLIEDGLMINGVPSDFMQDAGVETRMKKWDALKTDAARFKASDRYKLVKEYEDNIRLLTEIAKKKLLDELQWTSKTVTNSDGTKTEKLDGNIENLLLFVKKQLSRQDIADHEIDFLQMQGEKVTDLSLSLSVDKIEKLLNALVNKKLINQHVNGQGLIQISGAMFESINSTDRNYENPTAEDLAKYGTNDLPTYHVGADGKTAAMKVKIALQGDFLKLLEAKHTDGTRIGTTYRLNEMLKDEAWLNEGRNREMITMVGVRIPVQGLNSMEFMEVYEFLPAEAGNIIVPPAEIVAKSGSDFDIDKLTVMMPNLRAGRRDKFTSMFDYTREEATAAYKKYLDWKAQGVAKIDTGNFATNAMLSDLDTAFMKMFGMTAEELNEETVAELVEEGKLMTESEFVNTLVGAKSVQNDLIGNMKSILELPENFVNLTRPNSTDIFTNAEGTGLAQELAPFVEEYDPFEDSTQKEGISPTRVLEIEYNLYKHATNNVGKQTLGLAAVDNTYNAVFNRIGFRLNPTAGMTTKRHTEITKILAAKAKQKGKQSLTAEERKLAKERLSPAETTRYGKYHRQTLFLPHNTISVDGEKAISLSHDVDARGEHRVADVINQLLNGWLDVAKDAWIFNIQGNKEVSPVLLFLLQAGVPARSAVYFASMPMVRDYVTEQRNAKGTFAEPLGKAAVDQDGNVMPFWFRGKAKDTILGNPKYGFGIGDANLGSKREATVRREAISNINEDVLKDGVFDDKAMKKAIVSYSDAAKSGKQYVYTALDRAAFLHFLEAEAMAMPVRDVKLNMNFDTSKSGTLFEAQNRIIGKQELEEDSRFPVEMIDKMITDSPIGSFYVQEFQVDLFKDLFKVRSHPALTKFLLDKFKNGGREVDNQVKATFNDREKFANEFINDFISFIFQNSVRGFDTGNTYMGYEISQELYDLKTELLNAKTDSARASIESRMAKVMGVPVETVTHLKQGISRGLDKTADGTFIVEKTLYVDKNQLRKEWETKEYRNKAYTDKGLAKVNTMAFDTADEYYNFVYEREVLRKNKPYMQVKDGVAYRTALARVSADKVNGQKEGELNDDYKERLNKIAYEEYLRDTALTNTFNHWALFKSDNTFADQFVALKTEYNKGDGLASSFMSDFDLVHSLSVGASGSFSNLKLNDNFLEGDVINILHENLLALMDPNVVKVDNPTDNAAISELFRKFTIVAFLQSGMNTKSAFSLTRLVPDALYMRMIEGPVNDYVKHMNEADDSNKSPEILQRFYDTFVSANSFRNRQGKIRGKKLNGDYTLADSIKALKGDKPSVRSFPLPYEPLTVANASHGLAGYKGSSLSSSTVVKEKTANKKNTFVYDLALDNPNAINNSIGSLMYHNVPNSIGLPTLSSFTPGKSGVLVDVDGKIAPETKTAIDNAITALKQARADGQKLYFNIEGYGQYMTGYYKPLNKTDVAKQTFLYLSKQLLEEFNFINPGYLGTKVGIDTIQSEKFQPISDSLVLDFMKHCIK